MTNTIPISFIDNEGPLRGEYPFRIQIDPALMAAADAQIAEYGPAVSAYEAALATFNAGPLATFQAATTTYTAALTTYITAMETYGAAIGAWYAAGSPGSGPAYDTYSAAGAAAYTATTTWETTVQNTFGAAIGTFALTLDALPGGPPVVFNFPNDELSSSGTSPQSPFYVFCTAALAFLPAATTYGATYSYNYENAYANWVGAGSPGSGATYDAWVAAQAVLAAADATWSAALATFNAAIAAAAPIGYYVYSQAYASYEAGYSFWQTYNAAVSFMLTNPTMPNPYSSINPI